MLIPNWQRAIGIFLYMLPWSDAIPFGRTLFIEIPFLQWLAIPVLPILIFEQLIPLGSLLIFFGLFFGVVRNSKVPYFLRFNTLQALLLSIIIIIAKYGLEIIIRPLGNSLMLQGTSNTIFIVTLAITIFAIAKCLKGQEPDLPGISEAVRIQI